MTQVHLRYEVTDQVDLNSWLHHTVQQQQEVDVRILVRVTSCLGAVDPEALVTLAVSTPQLLRKLLNDNTQKGA